MSTQATSNKRQRADNASASRPNSTPTSGTPAASSPLDPLLPRQECLRALLASQPDQLRDIIISRTREMLVLRSTIQNNETNYTKLLREEKDSTTGETLKDDDGVAIPIIPTSIRTDCKVRASRDFSNEPSVQAILEQAKSAHTAHLRVLAKHIRDLAELEIRLRKDKLRHLAFELLKSIALSHDVIAEVKHTLPNTLTLSQEERAAKTVHEVLLKTTPAVCTALSAADSTALAADYCTYSSWRNTACNERMNDHDRAWLNPIITSTDQLFTPTITTLFESEDQRTEKQRIEARLKTVLQPKAISEATDMVDLTIADGNDPRPAQALADFCNNLIQRDGRRRETNIRKALRKNSSGDGKTTPSKPIKSGRGKKNSSASRSAHQPNNSNPQTQQKPADSASPSNNNQKRNKKKKKRGKPKPKPQQKDSQGEHNNVGNGNAPSAR